MLTMNTKTGKNSATARRAIAAAAAACLIVAALAACSGGGLSGTYKSSGLVTQSFTFSGGDKITMSAFGIDASGKYRISGDKMEITYSILGMESTWSCSFERRGKSIYLDGTEFVKQ